MLHIYDVDEVFIRRAIIYLVFMFNVEFLVIVSEPSNKTELGYLCPDISALIERKNSFI